MKLTQEQIEGLALHEKERQERCKRVLEKHSKPKEEKIKALPIDEGIKKPKGKKVKKIIKQEQIKLF